MSILDNHSHAPVPENERVTGVRIAIIIIGIGITLPAFLVGAEIVLALGFTSGFLACATAGMVLAIMATLAMLVGTRTHLSTAAIIRLTFGQTGSKLVNTLLSATLLGWFGVTAVLFGQVTHRIIEDVIHFNIPATLLVISGSVLMVLTTVFGFRAIDGLSRLAVPLLILMLFGAIFYTFQEMSWIDIFHLKPSSGHESIYSIGSGASLIIGSFIVGVTITPDMSRFARKTSDAVKGALISYGSGSQILLFLTGIPALATGEKDLILTMTMLGLGLPALAVMLLATWTTNVNNLYSSSLTFAQILPRWPDWCITVCAGIVGTVLAIVVGVENFIHFLIFLSIAIPPIAGIYITDFFLIRRSRNLTSADAQAPDWNANAFLAWLIAGCFGAYEVTNKISVTGVQAVDATLMAAIVFYFLSRAQDLKKSVFR
ncbi:MAG: cytosine permease [Gammaproteobacteria bacterium]|nr:cytosine permease [Gammaproteobacteria bacterium]